jgi:tRNA-splicing ligase RtcB
MKPHLLIAPWKGDKRYTEIAKRAAQLKKAGQKDDAIVAAISAEFGAPFEPQRLRDAPQPFAVFGSIGVGADIEPPALQQIELALRLPIAVRGALMPDAHPGYALPIGGVFAAHNAVSPSMVGVDIGCRMHLSVFDEDVDQFIQNRVALLDDLRATTVFGAGGEHKRPADHAVLDDARWKLTNQLRGLHDKAVNQLGTSGSGNHFAELIVGEVLLPDALGAALPQRFCGLLTHSGSRGVGYAIANHYMRVAAQETARVATVPKYYEWLDLDREAGQEYWHAMELAGAFARANHEVIHAAFARRTKTKVRHVVQNHHNFAWKDGDLVIHRKGATPAGVGVPGIIPGSMGTNSYIVVGKGNAVALESASHGAGRRSSRKAAKDSISMAEVRAFLKKQDIIVDGLSADESPMAYKDIERVMQLQVEAGLVEPVARMRPIAVIMAGEDGVD